MTKPQSYLIRMLIFLATVCAAGFSLVSPLRDAFLANTGLNSVILGVLLIGILHMFRLVLMLRPEVAWIESFRRDGLSVSSGGGPQLLAPMATMLGILLACSYFLDCSVLFGACSKQFDPSAT